MRETSKLAHAGGSCQFCSVDAGGSCQFGPVDTVDHSIWISMLRAYLTSLLEGFLSETSVKGTLSCHFGYLQFGSVDTVDSCQIGPVDTVDHSIWIG